MTLIDEAVLAFELHEPEQKASLEAKCLGKRQPDKAKRLWGLQRNGAKGCVK